MKREYIEHMPVSKKIANDEALYTQRGNRLRGVDVILAEQRQKWGWYFVF